MSRDILRKYIDILNEAEQPTAKNQLNESTHGIAENNLKNVNLILNTNGKGYWTDVPGQVKVVGFKVRKYPEDIYGELRVYFDPKTWSNAKNDLIYTDPLFLKELRIFLEKHGIPGRSIDYSEQGMQGRNYVSFEVGPRFFKAWKTST